MRKLVAVVVCSVFFLSGCGEEEALPEGVCVNALTAEEEAAGWRLLFDGETLAQWRSYQEDELKDGWGIEGGCLTRLSGGGDIITRDQFGDFELKLEWRISEAGNSGIFIRGDETERNIHHTGYEMQVLDNVGHKDSKDPTHRSGALYDLIEPYYDTTQPVGYWNRVHIIANGPHVEFWLNDRLTAKFEQGSPEWQALYEQSKFTSRPRYGTLMKGHIGLQDHWDKVWYRNIRVLALD